MPEGEAAAVGTRPKWVWDFGEPLPVEHDPAALLGGKGAGLHELVRHGFPVPCGFTISTEACRAYFDAGRTWPEQLWQQVREGVERLEARVGAPYGRGPRPLLLAVRSGGPRSMPGMLDTILHCGLGAELAARSDTPRSWEDHCRLIISLAAARQGVQLAAAGEFPSAVEKGEALHRQYRQRLGEPFPEDPWVMLRDAISAVWNSWYGRRAVQFRRARGWSDTPGTAIQVQAMVEVQSAGVLFTRDPRQPSSEGEAAAEGAMLIEAVFGSGDALVSGRLEPQRDALTEEQTEQLRQWGRRLEAHFQKPLDIEWGRTADEVVFFQVRPLEEQANASRVRALRERELERLRRLAGSDRRVLVRHSLAETVPAPTPLTWDVLRRFMSGSGGYGRMYRHLGYRPGRRVCETGFLELVFGRIYADVDRLPDLFCEGLPLRYDVERLRDDPSLLDQAPTEFDPRATDQRFLLRVPRMIAVQFRATRRLARLAHRAIDRYESEVLPPFLEYVQRERDRPLDRLPDQELHQLWNERCARVLDQFAPEAMLPGLLGGWELDQLERRLARLLGREQGRRFQDELLRQAMEPADSLPGALRRLAAGNLAPADFLNRFGHRGAGEMELANARWREDPSPLLGLAGSDRVCPEDGRPTESPDADGSRPRGAVSDDVATRLRERLAAEGGASFAPSILQRCARVLRLLPYREKGKDAWMRGYELLREVLEELARRWHLEGDIYFLTLDRLWENPPCRERWRDEAQARRETWQALQAVALPEVIEWPELDRLLRAPAVEPGAESFRGTPLSSGTARGPVLRLDTTDLAATAALDRSSSGYVLVCPTVDPGITPWLLGACGLVVQRGGVLSHGALVARQMGIPAVACPRVLDFVEEGTILLVDGHQGLVQVEKAEA